MAAGEGSVELRSPLLDVVIVNWNSGALLRECIAALAASSLASRLNVVVVDNASTDGSADALQRCALMAALGTASPVYRTCGRSTVPSSGGLAWSSASLISSTLAVILSRSGSGL